MTLKEIEEMFKVGQKVKVTREGNKPLVVHGNTGTPVMPALNGVEDRVIAQCKSAEWVMTLPDGRNVHTAHPKSSEVIEAKPGFLKFRYDNGTTITIEAQN